MALVPDIGGQDALPRATNEIRQRKLEATQRLLGDTIAITELDWQRPSQLPGWTRAHVAAHLSANAHALADAVDHAQLAHAVRMYPSQPDRFDAIERGSEKGGLQLQIDLDTSAGRLSASLDRLEYLTGAEPIRVSASRTIRLDVVPLARLNEVVLHHVDLDVGFRLDQLDPVTARWLLEWSCFWIADRPDYPPLELHAESGFTCRLGAPGEPLSVSGPDNLLLGWITGRISKDQFASNDLPALPLTC